jgi:hypothetical protein
MNTNARAEGKELHDEFVVNVHDRWNGCHGADVRLGALRLVHWHRPDRAPHEMVHGYVSCTDIICGQIPHECDHQTPHQLFVCVLKKHATPMVYDELVRRADGRASFIPRAPQPDITLATSNQIPQA